MEQIIESKRIPGKTFNFREDKVELITLEELRKTYHEVSPNDGKPYNGMYHFQVIEAVADILKKYNLDMQIQEIFAAQNKMKGAPGVSINPEIEKNYCENAIEAHTLRRVFTNINVYNYDNEELTTNVAIAYHQQNVAIAYGPMVKVCQNQCIMNPERVISTSRGMDIFSVIRQFEGYMNSFAQHIEEDKKFIDRMKAYPMNANQILQTIGIFTTKAVQNYTTIEEIKRRGNMPLNLSQVHKFTEDILVEMNRKNEITLWDMYNVATNLYKADNMEIPMLFNQHLALNNYVQSLLA